MTSNLGSKLVCRQKAEGRRQKAEGRRQKANQGRSWSQIGRGTPSAGAGELKKCQSFHYVDDNAGSYRYSPGIVKNAKLLKLNKLIAWHGDWAPKTRGEKMKVSSIMLLKTNGGKMSESSLSIMLMKRQVVTVSFPLC